MQLTVWSVFKINHWILYIIDVSKFTWRNRGVHIDTTWSLLLLENLSWLIFIASACTFFIKSYQVLSRCFSHAMLSIWIFKIIDVGCSIYCTDTLALLTIIFLFLHLFASVKYFGRFVAISLTYVLLCSSTWYCRSDQNKYIFCPIFKIEITSEYHMYLWVLSVVTNGLVYHLQRCSIQQFWIEVFIQSQKDGENIGQYQE